MANTATLIAWLYNLGARNLGGYGDSFTEWLWNCGNVFVGVELCELN